jgi:1,4-dihydroxy-2-naphthoyl-CoA hydrolase
MGVERDVAAFNRQVHELVPYATELDLEITEASPDRVVARAAWALERCTVGGVLHGGYLMAVADSTGAACAVLNLPADAAGTSTIESKTNFLGAVRGGVITVVSTPVHAGRTTIVVQTDVSDERGRLVSRTSQTQAVLSARS